MLRPHRLELERAELALRLESEVPGRDALGQIAGVGGQPEVDIANLEALEDVVLPSLIEDVDAVRGIELARLVEVHVHADAIRDSAIDLHAELQLRAQLGYEIGIAADLELCVAGLKPRPLATDFHPARDVESQVGVFATKPRRRLLPKWSFDHRTQRWRGSGQEQRRVGWVLPQSEHSPELRGVEQRGGDVGWEPGKHQSGHFTDHSKPQAAIIYGDPLQPEPNMGLIRGGDQARPNRRRRDRQVAAQNRVELDLEARNLRTVGRSAAGRKHGYEQRQPEKEVKNAHEFP